MKQLLTRGIILSRTDYGEADRIIILLTPEYGKLRLMAKGVRRVKSKLAGGIELFSVSHITFLQGRKDVGTLVSTRLIRHYGDIVKDIERVQLGYELIRMLDRATEDEPEPEYFELLTQAFEALNDSAVSADLIRTWFYAQLIKLGGHTPNLHTDTTGKNLAADEAYDFNIDDMVFSGHSAGQFKAPDIKLLRLLFSPTQPKNLQKIDGLARMLQTCAPLVRAMAQTYLRL